LFLHVSDNSQIPTSTTSWESFENRVELTHMKGEFAETLMRADIQHKSVLDSQIRDYKWKDAASSAHRSSISQTFQSDAIASPSGAITQSILPFDLSLPIWASPPICQASPNQSY
jgi:hypothetical protein